MESSGAPDMMPKTNSSQTGTISSSTSSKTETQTMYTGLSRFEHWKKRRTMVYLLSIVTLGFSVWGFMIETPTDLQDSIITGLFYMTGTILFAWMGLSTLEDNFGSMKDVFKSNK